jgi:hypothetical protein
MINDIKRADFLRGRKRLYSGVPISKISQSLSDLDLIPESAIDLLNKNANAKKLFRGLLDRGEMNVRKSRDYFSKVYEDNIHAEQAPFLSEIQQYMMDRKIIPSTDYVNITPEMMKATWMASKVADPAHATLRLFNIMQPSDKNFGLLASNLNRMLGIAPLGVAAYQGLNNKQR